MKPERFAQEAARFIKSLERMQGVVVFADQTLVVLSQPATKPSKPLTSYLLCFDDTPQPALRRSHWLAAKLHAKECIELHAGWLGKWSYKVGVLRKSMNNLSALIHSGVGPLKRYQNHDIIQKIAQFEARYTYLNELYQLAKHAELAPLLSYLVHVPHEAETPEFIEKTKLKKALIFLSKSELHQKLTNPLITHKLEAVAGFCKAPQRHDVSPHVYNTGAELKHSSQLRAFCALGTSLATPRLSMCGQDDAAHWVITAITRVAHLYSVCIADRLLRHGVQALIDGTEAKLRVRRAVAQFHVYCLTLSHPKREGEFPPLSEPYRHSPHGPALTREVARLFRAALLKGGVAEEILPSMRELSRMATIIRSHDPVTLGALFWQEHSSELLQSSRPAELSHAKACCAMIMKHPTAALPSLSKLSKSQISQLSSQTEDIPTPHLEAIWPALLNMKKPNISWDMQMFLEKHALTHDEFAMIITHDCLHGFVGDIPTHAPTRAALFACMRELERTGLLAHLELDNGWLTRLFTPHAQSKEYTILTLARALAAHQKGSTLTHQIQSFCVAINTQNAPLTRQLASWEDTRDTRREHGDKVKHLAHMYGDLSTQAEPLILRYLHHRGSLGEPLSLSQNILKKLEAPDLAAQREAIAQQLTQEREEARLAQLRRRLDKLEQGPVEGVMRKRRRAAFNLLEKSLAQIEQRSLTAHMDRAWLALLSSMTGRTWHANNSPLTPELRSILAVAQSDEFHPDVLQSFLTAALGTTARQELPHNTSWVKRARATSIDLAQWERGFEEHIVLGEQTLKVKTEHDLIRAAHMGTWFDTCLSLKDGCYAMSALLHPQEANKHVVYLEDEQGKIIARKLIAISKNFDLIGYPLYTTRDDHAKSALSYAMDSVISSFAGRCRLDMSHQGELESLTPRALPDDLIYYDGLEPWHMERQDTSQFPTPPPEWEQSIQGHMEWALHIARETHDTELLRAIAWRKRAPWCDYAVAALVAHDLSAAKRWFKANSARYCDPPTSVVHAIWHHATLNAAQKVELIKLACNQKDHWYAIHFMAWNMPSTRALEAAWLDSMRDELVALRRDSKRREHTSFEHLSYPPVRYAGCAVSMLLEIQEHAMEVFLLEHATAKDYAQNSYCLDMKCKNVQALKLSWLTQGADEQALADAITRASPHVAETAFEFAQEYVAPRITRALWSRWRHHTTRTMPEEARQELLSALLIHHDIADVVPPPHTADLCGIKDIRDLIARLQELGTSSHAKLKALTRQVKRALQHTLESCQAERNNQINHPDVWPAFEQLASHPDALEALRALIALSYMSDSSTHERAVQSLLDTHSCAAQVARDGDDDALRRLSRLCTGAARAQAFVQELARLNTSKWNRRGALLRLLARDIPGELSDQDCLTLACACLNSPNLIHNTYMNVENFFFWLDKASDSVALLEKWFNEDAVTYHFNQADDMGVMAVIDMLSQSQYQPLVERTLVMFTRYASPHGRLDLYTKVLTQYHHEANDPCAQLILNEIFMDNDEHSPLDAKCFIAKCMPQSSWEEPLSFRGVKACLHQARLCWSDEEWAMCRAQLESKKVHNPRARAVLGLIEALA